MSQFPLIPATPPTIGLGIVSPRIMEPCQWLHQCPFGRPPPHCCGSSSTVGNAQFLRGLASKFLHSRVFEPKVIAVTLEFTIRGSCQNWEDINKSRAYSEISFFTPFLLQHSFLPSFKHKLQAFATRTGHTPFPWHDRSMAHALPRQHTESNCSLRVS